MQLFWVVVDGVMRGAIVVGAGIRDCLRGRISQSRT